MDDKFHVTVHKTSWNEGLAITIWEERNGQIYVAAPVQLKMVKTDSGTAEEPTLRLSHFQAPSFLKAFAEALSGVGVRTDNDAKLSGVLEAQRGHLEDLRTLLKLRARGA